MDFSLADLQPSLVGLDGHPRPPQVFEPLAITRPPKLERHHTHFASCLVFCCHFGATLSCWIVAQLKQAFDLTFIESAIYFVTKCYADNFSFTPPAILQDATCSSSLNPFPLPRGAALHSLTASIYPVLPTRR